MYQWDWDAKEISRLSRSGSNGFYKQKSSRNEGLQPPSTSYIPTQIYGDPELVAGIKAVCTKYLSVFNTVLGPEPALVKPMELDVDPRKWRINSNKGPPRQQTQSKQEEVRKQIGKMLPAEVVSTSQAEYYSQVHLTPKPTHSPVANQGDDMAIHETI